MSEVMKLPPGWAVSSLSDLARIEMGQSPESVHYNSEGRGLPFFQGKTEFGTRHPEVRKWCTEPKKLAEPGDILLSVRAPVGPTNIAQQRACIGRGLAAIGVWKPASQLYLFYFFRHIEQWLSELGTGTTFAAIGGEVLKTLEVPVAPAAEQTRIVEKLEELLSDLDAGVAELKAAQRKLAQYRQALLKAAVEGGLSAEWRAAQTGEQETGAQLLARILAERLRRWEEKQLAKFQQQGKTPPKGWQDKYPEPIRPDTTGLPALPEGWVWSSLGQCFHVEVGATPSRKEPGYWNGNIPWVSSGEVRFARITKTKEQISYIGLQNSSTQINPIGSVLLGMIGEGKTRGQVAILGIEAANNQNCAAIWVTETDVPPEYVYFWLWSRYDETRRGSSGNNQPALNKSLVEKIPFPLPSLTELDAIVSLVSTSLSRIEDQEAAIAYSLTQSAVQHQNLLKAAFSGQLVPQDPNDEPASVLLERIRAERRDRSSSRANKRSTARSRKESTC